MPTRTVGTQTTASPDVALREKRKSRSCNCALMPQPTKKTRFTHPGDTSSPSSASVPNDQTPQTAADETTPWWMKRTEQEEEEFRRECEETATLNRKIAEGMKDTAQLSLKVQQCLKASDEVIRRSRKNSRITRKFLRRVSIRLDNSSARLTQILREGNRAIYKAVLETMAKEEEALRISTESNELHSSIDQDSE